MTSLFVEIYSEEIPSQFQGVLADAFESNIKRNLVEKGLSHEQGITFSTPRRIGINLTGIPAKSQSTIIEKRGPRKGAPDKAIEGFAKSNNVPKENLEIKPTPKGEFYFFSSRVEGIATRTLLPNIITNSLSEINLPKSMRWGSGRTKWIRPIRSLIGIFETSNGAEYIPFDYAEISSGQFTYGHRYMNPGPIKVNSFDSYETSLRNAHVLIYPHERKQIILESIEVKCTEQDLEPQIDEDLIDEIVGLVEWPVVLIGDVEKKYHDLPSPVLYTTMKKHQRFISARNKNGKISHFIIVANMETPDKGKTILSGNHRVLSSRLADAQFFLDQDFKFYSQSGLKGALIKLSKISYFKGLGSQSQRVERITALANELANLRCFNVDPGWLSQAATYSKFDLVSETVNELPELQGIMGRYFASRENLPECVSKSLEEHYYPTSQEGQLPVEDVGIVVSLADKINHLVGFSLIGAAPSGLGDPNAVRRATIGIIRIIVEYHLRGIGLKELIEFSMTSHLEQMELKLPTHASFNDSKETIYHFILSRFKNYLKQQFNYDTDIINACLAGNSNGDLNLMCEHIKVLDKFLHSPEGKDLLHIHRRITQLLYSSEAKALITELPSLDEELLEQGPEQELYWAFQRAIKDLADHSCCSPDELEFESILKSLTRLRQSIDFYFDNVIVFANSPKVKKNRLALLSQIIEPLNQQVDISLVTQKI